MHSKNLTLNNYYFYFIQDHGLKKLRKIKTDIIKSEVSNWRKIPSTKNCSELDIYFIRKIISYIFNARLISEISKNYIENRKCVLPIPRIWDKFFEEENIFIAKILSRARWFTLVSGISYKSVFKGLRTILKKEDFVINKIISTQKASGKKVIFLNENFPATKIFSNEYSNNFGHWYAQHLIPNENFAFIHFNKEIGNTSFVQGNRIIECFFVPRFTFGLNIFSKLRLFNYALRTFIIGVLHYFRVDTKILFAFNDLMIQKRMQLISKNELPDKIIFTDADGILMPIWVNFCVENNIEVQYIFLSSYDSPQVYENEESRQDFWALNGWPNIFCVDNYQCDFIQKNCVETNQKVAIVGFPELSDNKLIVPETNQMLLSVFDYEPGLNHLGMSTISDSGYFTYESNINFIQAIYDIAKELNILILHKPKRDVTLLNRPIFYKNFINELDPKYYISISPSVSPRKLISKTSLTVSMPLTSTGFIAKSLKVNSVFFDPNGKIVTHDPALREIPLIKETIALRKIIFEEKMKIFGNI